MKEDAILVADALANGPEAFGPIVEKYKGAVFAVALVRLRNFHDAEDLTQSTFLDAFERLDRLNDPNRLGAWLRSLAIHRCLNFLRQKKKTEEVLQRAAVEHVLPQDQMNGAAVREQVLEALNSLSKVQRETVTLFYISGYAQEEIAGIQEVPVGTIKWRLHEARKRLKAEMLAMVKETLHEEAPNEDFARRVYELVCRYPESGRWHPNDGAVVEELKKIGTPGIEGFIKALSISHWPTRDYVIHMISSIKPDPVETVIALLKRSLKDTNKHVRGYAGHALLHVDVDAERKRAEFIPLITDLLDDRSNRVRRVFSIGWIWGEWLADIPVEVVARSLVEESVPGIRQRKEHLLKAILEAQKK